MSKKLGFALSGIMLAMAAGTAFAANDMDGGQLNISGLLNAVPRLDAEGETMLTIPGNPPNLLRLPKGCPFQPRCPHAMEICSSAPPLEEFTPGRLRACFKPVEELL